MARPRIQDAVILEVKGRRAEGLTLDQIQNRMQQARDNGSVTSPMPSRNTIAKYTREYDILPLPKKNLDKPFEWHLMEEYGLPWEASPFLLEMWASFLGWGKYFPISNPSVREIRWWWRIHLAAPELDKEFIWRIAQWFLARELVQVLLNVPLELADLEAFLAYKPWVEANREAYERAISHDMIPAIQPLSLVSMQTIPLEDKPNVGVRTAITFFTASRLATLFPESMDSSTNTERREEP